MGNTDDGNDDEDKWRRDAGDGGNSSGNSNNSSTPSIRNGIIQRRKMRTGAESPLAPPPPLQPLSSSPAPTTRSNTPPRQRRLRRLKPPPFTVRCNPSGSVKEPHGKPIYCLTWSQDVHQNDGDGDGDDSDGDGSDGVANAPSSSPNAAGVYRYLATCAGRQASVYRVRISSQSQSQSQSPPDGRGGGDRGASAATTTSTRSGPFEVQQSYEDDDLEEDLYACAFAGRSQLHPTPRVTPVVGTGAGTAASAGGGAAPLDREGDYCCHDGGEDGGDAIKSSRGGGGVSFSSSSSLKRQKAAHTNGYNSINRKRGRGGAAAAATDRGDDLDDDGEGGGRFSGNDDDEFKAHNGSYYKAPVRQQQPAAAKRRQRQQQRRQRYGPQLLCVAGLRRTIKVLDTVRRCAVRELRGHGDEIYDLKANPADGWMLLSASKDESVRLWNLRDGSAVAVFAGHGGHRDAVVSVAWHVSGNRMASAGMDNTVKLWSCLGPADSATRAAIARSKRAARQLQERAAAAAAAAARSGGGASASASAVAAVEYRSSQTVVQQFPMFSTNQVHTQWVDCVQFVGDLILSKSTDNRVVLWSPVWGERDNEDEDNGDNLEEAAAAEGEPTAVAAASSSGGINDRRKRRPRRRCRGLNALEGMPIRVPPPNKVVRLRSFEIQKAEDVWMLRFGADVQGRMLAVGNCVGEVLVWNMEDDPTFTQRERMENRKNTKKKRGDGGGGNGGGGGGTSSSKNAIKHQHKLTCRGGAASNADSALVRWVSFSPCGNVLVASTETGSLYKWNIQKKYASGST